MFSVAACQPTRVQTPAISGATGPAVQASVPTVSSIYGSTVQIGVSSCTTENFGTSVGSPDPVGTPARDSVSIPVSVQGRLGAYGDSRDLLLAPIGWACGAAAAISGLNWRPWT